MGSKITETPSLSPIQSFYAGQTLFITGATGFLGKLVLEKLLRDCDEIRKIYLLVRPKRGIDERQRMSKLFDSQAFDHVKKTNPNFQDKIYLIEGDLKEPIMGISQDDQELLKSEVTCILHLAATVKFTEPIRLATHINVRALHDLIEMAKEMKQLRVLVHISTAFSHCTRTDIGEKVYKSVMHPKDLMNLVETLDEDLLEAMTPALLGANPNTYCLTKGVAEYLVEEAQKDIPVAIVRPSIVMSSYREPFEGWTDTIYGLNGITLGVALGIIRTMRMDLTKRCDVVPADFVVNCIIAAACETANLRTKNYQKPVENADTNNYYQDNSKTDIPVFNCVTSAQNSTTWGKFIKQLETYGPEYGSPRCIWHYVFVTTKSEFWYTLFAFLLHTIPGRLVDLVLWIIGKEPMLVKGYQKISKHLDALGYFTTKEWTWTDENVQKMFRNMDAKDQKLFFCDVKQIEWELMIRAMLQGGRRYLLKDTDDTLPAGRRKLSILKYLHYCLVTFLLYLLYKFLNFAISLFVSCLC